MLESPFSTKEGYAMREDTVVQLRQPGSFEDDPLTEVLRLGARRLLGQAVEAEVAGFVEAYAHLTDSAGRRRIVRHGHLPEREIQNKSRFSGPLCRAGGRNRPCIKPRHRRSGCSPGRNRQRRPRKFPSNRRRRQRFRLSRDRRLREPEGPAAQESHGAMRKRTQSRSANSLPYWSSFRFGCPA